MILYILVGLAALGISWWSYRNLVPQISQLKRALLITLRSLGIFLIAALLLEPLITRFSEKTTGNKLGVVFDLSSSMQQDDVDRKRHEIALSTFSSAIPDNVNIRYFGFSDSLSSLKGIPDRLAFKGGATNLARAIIDPVKASNGEIGALLLVTDGAGNIGSNPLAAAMMSTVPVYSLVVGQSISYNDVSLTRVNFPPVSYINTGVEITLEVKSSGYEGQSAIIEIRDDNRTVGSKTVTLPADGAYTSVTFPLTFSEEGVKNLRAIISSFDDEAHIENNIREFTIKLLKDKTRILLMSSSINWEYTFLLRALQSDSHFDVITAISRANGIIPASDLPLSFDAWQEMDLVIALDLASSSVAGQINNLKSAIESGIGFLFIAGDRTRHNLLGGWDEILPLAANRNTTVVRGEFFPIPGKQAFVRAVTDIEGIEWDKLSPLEYLYKNVELKSNSFVFLDVIEGNRQHQPVLAGGFNKMGKTAAILGYPWWKRSFRPEPGGQSADAMNKFWGNLVRWLVAREDLDKFNLVSDKTVYRLGEPVEFSAILFDDSYNLLSGAQISVQIRDSSESAREFYLGSTQEGRYSGIYGSPAPGKYRYSGYAMIDNDTLSSAAGEFIVESFGLEMENPSANYSLMQQIASVTGAASYSVENFGDFPSELKLKVQKEDIFREYGITGNTYVLFIILVLFALEWGIRKFSQLA